MIKKKMIFILGAGASMDFGYPSGRNLKNQIISDWGASNDFYDRVVQPLSFKYEIYESFCKALRYSGRPSVDEFLEYRQEYIDIGKILIAYHILTKENIDGLFRISKNIDNWYEYLFQKMVDNASFDDFAKNQINVITFNYDRSLEAYLFTALKHAFDKTEQEVAGVLSDIPIIHVHGSIGYLPWQLKNGRPYQSSYTNNELILAANSIRIVSETSQIDEAFGEANELMQDKTSRVIFLGFGYHSQNINRLNVLSNPIRAFYGTTFGLEKSEILAVQRKFNPKQFHKQSKSVIEYLRSEIIFDLSDPETN